MCACDFTGYSDVAQSTVSHHLKVLKEAGWVTAERRGTWIWYSLCPDAVERFRQIAGEIVPGMARPAASLGGGPADCRGSDTSHDVSEEGLPSFVRRPGIDTEESQ